MNFSKSKYTTVWQCPKALWLQYNMPEKAEIDDEIQKRMVAGNIVGDLAMGYFGDFVEVTEKRPNSEELDLTKMTERTKEEMAKGTNVICEASFIYDGFYCAVDILKKEKDGYAIYEVKSSTTTEIDKGKNPKDVYIADIAYQKYVLQKCGVNVTGTYLVLIDTKYVRGEDFEIKKFFRPIDVDKYIDKEYLKVESNLNKASEILKLDKEPEYKIGAHCDKPHECAFWKYCSRNLPVPSTFNLYKVNKQKAADLYYNEGIITIKDFFQSQKKVSDICKIQIDHILNNKTEPTVTKEIVKKFLDSLSYPLYFLDFETMQSVIPDFVGTRPYQQIPFQYSLHYIEYEGGPLLHKEFLGESGTNPMRKLAEQLCQDIPMNVCTMAYHSSFESGRIEEMAKTFPDLSNHLLDIKKNLVDLEVPFKNGGYYKTEMEKSFSIKSVLPALFPGNPELNYHNLDQIHNGGEAMDIFPKICKMPKEEQIKARNNLLKYCGLDTLAMVRVWEELERAVK